MAGAAGGGGMEVPGWIDGLGRLVERGAGFWRRLGDLESRIYAHELEGVAVDRPVYVAGLARAGTTILLEILAGRPGVATHRYRDFPPVYTPILWNRAFAQVYKGGAAPAERAHKDRILVTPDSPEALEEVLWMRFFPGAHEAGRSQVLDAATSNPAFERFYADHLRKILLVRGGARYLSKGNYNLTRLAYLRRLFPDARFLVPVRDPLWHVASLMKQHALFCAEETRDPRILAHMRRAGHLEFGLDRRAIDVGDGVAAEVEALWAAGDEARGWARYWNSLHRFVARQRAADPPPRRGDARRALRGLCARPRETLRSCWPTRGLPARPRGGARRLAAGSPRRPTTRPASPPRSGRIAEETAEARGLLGYGDASRGRRRPPPARSRAARPAAPLHACAGPARDQEEAPLTARRPRRGARVGGAGPWKGRRTRPPWVRPRKVSATRDRPRRHVGEGGGSCRRRGRPPRPAAGRRARRPATSRGCRGRAPWPAGAAAASPAGAAADASGGTNRPPNTLWSTRSPPSSTRAGRNAGHPPDDPPPPARAGRSGSRRGGRSRTRPAAAGGRAASSGSARRSA
jgi:hypothetical protein